MTHLWSVFTKPWSALPGDELGKLVAGGGPEPEQFGELGERYGIEFQPETVVELCEKYGLEHPLLNPQS
jgi:hypothetical protein